MSEAGTLPKDRRAPQGADDPNAQNLQTLGDYLELDGPGDDDITISDGEDGHQFLTIGQPYENPSPTDGEFYENLADVLPEHILEKIASDLLNKIDEDKRAREKGDKKYEEGLRRTGFGDDAPGGATFEGASRAVHPGLGEAAIDYEARVIKELWPIAGPVREKILGVVTAEKNERAKRKTEYLNYQLTTQIKEARSTMETTLMQVPMGGVQYIRQWWDHRLMRPRWQFVPRDNVWIPANATSWYTAQRRTWRDTVSAVTLKERMDSGLYRKIDNLASAPAQPEPTKTQEANQKIEGLELTGVNQDGDRDIYEVMSLIDITEDTAQYLQVEEAGTTYPYLLSIDATTKKVLAIYRDWEENDPTYEPIDHLYEFQFIPWRGAYALGLPQIIGSLNAAATGAMRALLDSAHIANTQGGLILKGSGTGAQTKRPNFGEFTEIDGSGLATPDIRARVMQFETKEPSNVLFQLLGFLVETQKGTVRTSLDEMNQEMNPNVPVGTQLSRVEEGLVVFSAIHGRVHEAFDRLLAGLHRLNRLYMPDLVRVDAQGKEILVRRSDFEGPLDIQPVSDPTIYSDQQRMAQIQAILQRAALLPGLYDLRKLEERFLKLLKVPDADELLLPKPEPQELNAVNENVSLALGRPVQAFPEQDHEAHLMTHLMFLASPAFGFNPLFAPKVLAPMLQHLSEHMVLLYAKMANDMVSQAANRRAVDLMSTDPQVKQAFDRLLAVASARVMPQATMQYQQHAAPVIMQAMQMLKQMQPQTPQDPAAAALQASTQETQRKAQADQQNAQNDAQRNQNDQVRNAIMAERNQVTEQVAEQRSQTDIARTQLEGDTARDIAAMRISSGGRPTFSDGASLE